MQSQLRNWLVALFSCEVPRCCKGGRFNLSFASLRLKSCRSVLSKELDSLRYHRVTLHEDCLQCAWMGWLGVGHFRWEVKGRGVLIRRPHQVPQHLETTWQYGGDATWLTQPFILQMLSSCSFCPKLGELLWCNSVFAVVFSSYDWNVGRYQKYPSELGYLVKRLLLFSFLFFYFEPSRIKQLR